MTMILSTAATLWTSTIILLYLHSGDSAEIIGGKEVKPHSLPYMALLTNKKGHQKCGGILIHQKWVLTAAHCTDIDKVFLGVHSFKHEEKETRQVLKVKGRVPHPCYDPDINVNDIMLLKLDKKVKLTKAVKPLALLNLAADVPAGTQCSVSGWGVTKNNAKTVSDVLLSTNVTVIDRRKCNSADYYNMNPIITYSMMCAGSVDKTREDSCQGDSGGPLVCGGELRGVVSFGKGCGIKTKSGVYTIISKYHDWINKTLRKSLID